MFMHSGDMKVQNGLALTHRCTWAVNETIIDGLTAGRKIGQYIAAAMDSSMADAKNRSRCDMFRLI